MAFTTLINALFLPGKPILGSTGLALRDNLDAFMSGDPSIVDAQRQRVLLGTLATTSGSTVTLSSLDLTYFRSLVCVFDGVSMGTTVGVQIAGVRCTANLASAGGTLSGVVWVDLFTGVFGAFVGENTANGSAAFGGATGYSTATTSVSFSTTSGNFDAGSIYVYGVK